MDAADSSRAEEPDADPGGDGQRATHGRRPDGALNRARGEIARAGLARLRSEALELARLETYADAAVEHADRRRNGAGGAHGGVAREPDLDAVRRGEAVRDERRLERDDRVARVERGAHLLGDLDERLHGRQATASPRASGRSGRRPRARGRGRRRSSPRRARLPPPWCRRHVRRAEPDARRRRTRNRARRA